ncbi:MAG: hypothetical protein LBS19_16495 [Clostridiales bacterium]|jgi:hypothetical protein|nr:hypothetical protein [Clostridiales bacterium]
MMIGTGLILKELRLHTLRGDIQTCGMDGLSKEGIRQLLYRRYVRGAEIPVTGQEFSAVLDEEYAKVAVRRASRTK